MVLQNRIEADWRPIVKWIKLYNMFVVLEDYGIMSLAELRACTRSSIRRIPTRRRQSTWYNESCKALFIHSKLYKENVLRDTLVT